MEISQKLPTPHTTRSDAAREKIEIGNCYCQNEFFFFGGARKSGKIYLIAFCFLQSLSQRTVGELEKSIGATHFARRTFMCSKGN